MAEDAKRNPNFIEVSHGHLKVNVPLSAYEGTTYHIKPEEAEKLKKMLASRYPWLSPNALKVFIEEAEQAMNDRIQSQLEYMEKARHAMQSGNYTRAKRMTERHIEAVPDDADAWYVLGESLCKLGETDEGFAAITKARNLAKKK
ncbi:MAG TPA: tetratricopeptide repeat protein [Methanomassiliicoccales archaeon]|nr:tetratricopeptide repeat protein [Methanomassiliicoccales archaeon]HQQ24735.1 tetratricopeptide repeat protein [Methanomassiliicoccales archaeon]